MEQYGHCSAQGSLIPSSIFSSKLILMISSEPIGSSIPKFSTNQVTSGFVSKSMTAFALTCPAQGNPTPSYRSVVSSLQSLFCYVFLKIFSSINPLLALNNFSVKITFPSSEPIGSTAPKFSSSSNSLGDFAVTQTLSHSLSCPAQASPTPSFRLVDLKYQQ